MRIIFHVAFLLIEHPHNHYSSKTQFAESSTNEIHSPLDLRHHPVNNKNNSSHHIRINSVVAHHPTLNNILSSAIQVHLQTSYKANLASKVLAVRMAFLAVRALCLATGFLRHHPQGMEWASMVRHLQVMASHINFHQDKDLLRISNIPARLDHR